MLTKKAAVNFFRKFAAAFRLSRVVIEGVLRNNVKYMGLIFPLLVPLHKLFCLFLAIADIGPRYVVQPNWVRIIILFDQNPTFEIRNSIYGGTAAVSEPSGILFSKFYLKRF